MMLPVPSVFQGGPGLFGSIQNTGGGIRTHTLVPQERILSPQRLPFRHAGMVGAQRTSTASSRIKMGARPVWFADSDDAYQVVYR